MRCYHYFFKRIRQNLIPFQNMSAKNSVKINVIKGSFIKKVTIVSLLAISLTLTIVQTPLTPAVAAVFPIFVADPAKADSAITISTTIFGAGVATNVGVSLSGFDGTQRYQVTATSTEG